MTRKLTRQEKILLWITSRADARLLKLSDREWEKHDNKVLQNFCNGRAER